MLSQVFCIIDTCTLLSQEEVANIRSALFLIVQQSRPYNAVHPAQQSQDNHNTSSQMSHDILSQLSEVSDASHSAGVPSRVEKCKAVTVVCPDLSMDTDFSFVDQPWVELKPQTCNEFPAPTNNRVKLTNSVGDLKGSSPRCIHVSGDSCGEVVYAQVPPLSYNDASKKKVPLPSMSPSHEHRNPLPLSFLACKPSAMVEQKSCSLASHSDPLLAYHSPIVPPPKSVALQIPPSLSQPRLSIPQQLVHPPNGHFKDSIEDSTHRSRSLTSILPTDPEREVQHTGCPQACVDETKATRVDARFRTLTTDAVTKENSQTAARIDAHLEKLASKPHHLTTEGLTSEKNDHPTSTSGTMVHKDMECFPPEVGSRCNESFVAQTGHEEIIHPHTRGSHRPVHGFDVTALLEGLRRLDKAQGQLQATTCRLGQKPGLYSSSSAPSLMKSNAEQGQSKSSSSPFLTCFTKVSPTHSSEDGELEVRQEALFSVLTPILEENTLTGSQLNTTLEEYGGEREEKDVSTMLRPSRSIQSLSFDQGKKDVDQASSATEVCCSKPALITEELTTLTLATNITTECGIKPCPLISLRDNEVEEVAHQQSNHPLLHHQHHSATDDFSSCVGSSSIFANAPASRALCHLRQSSPELPSHGPARGGNDPAMWFALRSHLVQ